MGTHYNVAPGYMMPVISKKSPNRAVLMKWGLIPFWAKDPRIGYQMINARAETLKDKPAFRKPLSQFRCLVPANGFYEWKKTQDGKQPFYIRLKSEEMFAFAGLYDQWVDAEGKEIETYTIITTTPNSVVEPIHNRMPAILKKENEEIWLNHQETDINKILALLTPNNTTEEFEAYPVSKAVNKPENDSKDLIKLYRESQLQEKLF